MGLKVGALARLGDGLAVWHLDQSSELAFAFTTERSRALSSERLRTFEPAPFLPRSAVNQSVGPALLVCSF